MKLLVFVFILPLLLAVSADLDKKFGESCTEDSDCETAYSFCKKGKCKCIDGFNEGKDGQCRSEKLLCPTWKGHESSKGGKICTYYTTFNWTVDYVPTEHHDCDKKTEFCFLHHKEETKDGKHVGHCCTKPPSENATVTLPCPLGVKDDNGTCPDYSGVPADAPGPISTCSYVSHDCIRIYNQGACCPLPCRGRSSHFSVEGKCFDTGLIGDKCTHSAQCGGGSFCKKLPKGSLCQCKGKVESEPTPHCVD